MNELARDDEVMNISSSIQRPTTACRRVPRLATILISKLVHIDTLIRSTLKRLLLSNTACRRESETEVTVQELFTTAKSLWLDAPNQWDDIDLGVFDSWLIAESIRRSMFAAIFVRGIWYMLQSGYCHFEPFLESLPFDPRAGLWESSSEQEWLSIVQERVGNSKLKSWHEFTEGSARTHLKVDEDGQFQRMLFVSFHGSLGIECVKKMDKEI